MLFGLGLTLPLHQDPASTLKNILADVAANLEVFLPGTGGTESALLGDCVQVILQSHISFVVCLPHKFSFQRASVHRVHAHSCALRHRADA